MNGTTRCIVVAVSVVIAGCGQAAPPSPPPPTSSPMAIATATPPSPASFEPSGFGLRGAAPGGSDPAPSPGPGSDSEEVSPFSRHETPPGGVSSFIAFAFGEALLCSDDDDVVRPSAQIIVGNSGFPIGVCVSDVTPDVPVEAVVEGPGGWEWRDRAVADESGLASFSFDDLPSPIDGSYDLEALQGTQVLEDSLVLELDALHAVVLPDPVAVGDETTLYVAGNEPEDVVSTYLYRSGDGQWDYAADLGTVSLDAFGDGRLTLAPQDGDPIEEYKIFVIRNSARRSTWEILGDVARYSDLASAMGLACDADSPDQISCEGTIGGHAFELLLFALDDGRIDTIEISAPVSSHEALELGAAFAAEATGTAEAATWLLATEPGSLYAEHRFGPCFITISESDLGWFLTLQPSGSVAQTTEAEFHVTQ